MWQQSFAVELSKQQYELSGRLGTVSYEVVIEFVRLISVIFAIHEDRR